MAVDRTADQVTIGRGGFPSIGPKVGLIQATLNLVTLTSADDTCAAFVLPAGTLVLAIGFEVIVATTNAVTGSFGYDGTGDGSRTEFSGELATNGAVGTKLAGGEGFAGIILTDADTIVLEISADVGAALAKLRAWALIVDINDMV